MEPWQKVWCAWRDEQVDPVRLPVAKGTVYGQSPQEFANMLAHRLTVSVGMVAFK